MTEVSLQFEFSHVTISPIHFLIPEWVDKQYVEKTAPDDMLSFPRGESPLHVFKRQSPRWIPDELNPNILLLLRLEGILYKATQFVLDLTNTEIRYIRNTFWYWETKKSKAKQAFGDSDFRLSLTTAEDWHQKFQMSQKIWLFSFSLSLQG